MNTVLSAKNLGVVSKILGRSFMYTIKRRGLKIIPGGTPY